MGKFEISQEALAFMTVEEEEAAEVKTKKASKKKKKELKNSRINLALRESLVEQLKEEAWKDRKSLNAYIEEILIDHLKKKGVK